MARRTNRRIARAWWIIPLYIAVLLIGLSSCGGTPPATEAPEPPSLPPPSQPKDTPLPPPPADPSTSLLTDSAGAQLDVSIAVVEEETQGSVLQVIVRNESEGDLDLRIPCGLIFMPGQEDLQRLMVIQEDGITVPAGGVGELSPYVICIDAGAGLPEMQVEYTIGTIAEGNLLKLAECICAREFVTEEEDPLAYLGEQFGLQFSVWQVSGGLTPEELREEIDLGGGAFDAFNMIVEAFDAISQMLPSTVNWIEECGVEVAQ